MASILDPVLTSLRWLDVLVAPVVISVLLISIMSVAFAVFARDGRSTLLGFFGRVLGFYLGCSVPVVILGVIVGYVTGFSRTPIAGTLLTASLTLVGAVVVYAFGADNRYRVAIGVCVTVFALNVLLGLQYGSSFRESGRQRRLEALAVQEFAVRNFRTNLGLPAEPPAWMLGGEPQATGAR